jgi:hypothetical protein
MQRMNSIEPCGFENKHGKAELIVGQASFQNSRVWDTHKHLYIS